jgi:molybdate transport system substrate-binding protein
MALGPGQASGEEPAPLVVAAASDLRPAMEKLAPLFLRKEGVALRFIYGSTGLFARQAENGAPFDVFLAADAKVIEDLAAKGTVIKGSVAVYGVGRLAVWISKETRAPPTIRDLARAEFRRIAIANPAHAPYGRAAKEALASAGVLERVEARLVYAENVRQALEYAKTRHADAAIVALSLVNQSGGAYQVVPDRLHRPIVQAGGILARSERKAAAAKFMRHLAGPDGLKLLRSFGFEQPGVRDRSAK